MASNGDRIAKRQAEIAEQHAALDRDAPRLAADDDCRPDVVHRRGNHMVRSAAFLIVTILLAAGLLGLAVTLTRLAGPDFDDATRQGTARIMSCERHGPVSAKGFGFWESCTASVRWDSGDTDRITVAAVFARRDVGTDVRVGDLGKYRARTLLARAGAEHRPWLTWAGYAVGVVGLVPTLIATLSVRELLRFRRR